MTAERTWSCESSEMPWVKVGGNKAPQGRKQKSQASWETKAAGLDAIGGISVTLGKACADNCEWENCSGNDDSVDSIPEDLGHCGRVEAAAAKPRVCSISTIWRRGWHSQTSVLARIVDLAAFPGFSRRAKLILPRSSHGEGRIESSRLCW